MREAGAGEIQVCRIGMIDGREQTIVRLQLLQIQTFVSKTCRYRGRQRSTGIERGLRQLIRAAATFDSTSDTVVIDGGDAALPIGSAHLYQTQTHLFGSGGDIHAVETMRQRG